MIIEYIGLPGSGKTTHLKKAIEKYEGKVILTREILTETKIPNSQYIVFFYKYWKLNVCFFIGVVYNFEFNIKKWYTLVKGVNDTLKQYSKLCYLINDNLETIILLDEGLLQRSISVFCYNPRKFNRYLLKLQLNTIKQISLINRVEYFKIPIDKAINRCENRKDGLPYRYRNIDTKDLKKKFYLSTEGLNMIKDIFCQNIIVHEQ